VIYLPPSSPALSPLEPCWSKVKTALRKAKARTREALECALEPVVSTVPAVDARHWCAHCGYTIQYDENRSRRSVSASGGRRGLQGDALPRRWRKKCFSTSYPFQVSTVTCSLLASVFSI
jgi:hypothetical protein